MKEHATEFGYFDKYGNEFLQFSPDETALTISASPKTIPHLFKQLSTLSSFEIGSFPSRGLISVQLKKDVSLSSSLLNELKNILKSFEKDIHIQNAFIDQNNTQRFFSPNACAVQFQPGLPESHIKALLKEAGFTILHQQKTPGLYILQVNSPTSLIDAIEILNAKREVVYAGPYELIRNALPQQANAVPTPNDDFFSLQWSLENTGQLIRGTKGTPGADIKARDAWTITYGGYKNDVVVVIEDTGAELNHEDLRGNLYPRGTTEDWNVLNDTNTPAGRTPQDDQGHGTHVAGISTATGGNNKGIIGVAYDTQFAPIKAFDSTGHSTNADIRDGITTALTLADLPSSIPRVNRRVILNCSFTSGDDPLLRKTLDDALTRRNVLIVAAAGNDSLNMDLPQNRRLPASHNSLGLLAVAASDQNDARATFSNFGTADNFITAPGVNIASTYMNSSTETNRYWYLNGTSMAAPIVSGAAALLWSLFPRLNASWVEIQLRQTSDPKPGLPGGRLNIFRAVNAKPIAFSGKDILVVHEEKLYRYVLDATGRTVQRKVEMRGSWPGFTSMAAHSDGNVYIINEGLLYKVNLATETGSVTVVSSTNRFDYYSALTGHSDGNLYIINNGKLHRVNPQNGQTLKTFSSSTTGLSSITSFSNSEIFFITEGGLHRLNTARDKIERVGTVAFNKFSAITSYMGKLRVMDTSMKTIDPLTGRIVAVFSDRPYLTFLTSAGNNLYYLEKTSLKVSYPRPLEKAKSIEHEETIANISDEHNSVSTSSPKQRVEHNSRSPIPSKQSRSYSTWTRPVETPLLDEPIFPRKTQVPSTVFFPSVKPPQVAFNGILPIASRALRMFRK